MKQEWQKQLYQSDDWRTWLITFFLMHKRFTLETIASKLDTLIKWGMNGMKKYISFVTKKDISHIRNSHACHNNTYTPH